MGNSGIRPVVGRLAPSPTGALHLGNARSLLLAWISARQQSGTLLLRIEDIDSPRVKPGAAQETLQDLKWLGLDWDEQLVADAHKSSKPMVTADDYLQSARLDRFLHVLEDLICRGLVYPCSCSRKDVADASTAPHENGLPALEGDVYPRTCCGREWESGLPQKFCYRWRFASGSSSWRDAVYGAQSCVPEVQLGDFVVAKSLNGTLTPAYQLAVVVDDHEQGITEVVRGNDLICSTYRQLAVYSAQQWQPPMYCHVPLIVGTDGKRLAKRHGDTRLEYFRETGIRPQAILGFLANSIGLIDRAESVTPSELLGTLDWSRIPQRNTVFDLAQDLPRLRAM